MKIVGAALGAAIALACTSAQASVITDTFDLTASNFTLEFGGGTPAPIDPVHLNFTLTFDPSVSTAPGAAGLTVNSFNLPYSTKWSSFGSGDLVLATDAGSGGCGNPADSYCVFIYNTGTPSASAWFQQSTSSGDYWVANNVALTITPGAGGVPEPMTWALMLIGIAGLGAALRARRGVALAAA